MRKRRATNQIRPLTKAQHHVLTYVDTYIETNGIAPVISEVAAHIGTGMIAALEHLQALEVKGRIRREKQKARGITVIRPAGGRCPYCGQAVAEDAP